MRQQYGQAQQAEQLLAQRLESIDLTGKIQRYREIVEQNKRLLLSTMTSQYDSKVARFEKAQDALLSLDTSRIVARGYAIVQKNQKAISSTKQVEKGDLLQIQMQDGSLEVEVKDVK